MDVSRGWHWGSRVAVAAWGPALGHPGLGHPGPGTLILRIYFFSPWPWSHLQGAARCLVPCPLRLPCVLLALLVQLVPLVFSCPSLASSCPSLPCFILLGHPPDLATLLHLLSLPSILPSSWSILLSPLPWSILLSPPWSILVCLGPSAVLPPLVHLLMVTAILLSPWSIFLSLPPWCISCPFPSSSCPLGPSSCASHPGPPLVSLVPLLCPPTSLSPPWSISCSLRPSSISCPTLASSCPLLGPSPVPSLVHLLSLFVPLTVSPDALPPPYPSHVSPPAPSILTLLVLGRGLFGGPPFSSHRSSHVPAPASPTWPKSCPASSPPSPTCPTDMPTVSWAGVPDTGLNPDMGPDPVPPFVPPEESDYLTEYEDEGMEPVRGEEDAFAPSEWASTGALEAVSVPGRGDPPKWGAPGADPAPGHGDTPKWTQGQPGARGCCAVSPSWCPHVPSLHRRRRRACGTARAQPRTPPHPTPDPKRNRRSPRAGTTSAPRGCRSPPTPIPLSAAASLAGTRPRGTFPFILACPRCRPQAGVTRGAPGTPIFPPSCTVALAQIPPPRPGRAPLGRRGSDCCIFSFFFFFFLIIIIII